MQHKSIESIRKRDRELDGVQESGAFARFRAAIAQAFNSYIAWLSLLLIAVFACVVPIVFFDYPVYDLFWSLVAWGLAAFYLLFTAHQCKTWWINRPNNSSQATIRLVILVGACLIGVFLLFWARNIEPTYALSLLVAFAIIFILFCLMIHANPKLSSLTIPLMLYFCFYLSLQGMFHFHETLQLSSEIYRSLGAIQPYLNSCTSFIVLGLTFLSRYLDKAAQIQGTHRSS